MIISLSIDACGPIFRIGRRPNPWEPLDWSLAGADGTFGNRFDDLEATYRVLYASSQRLGCYLETLARFWVDIKLYAELGEIAGEDDFVPRGVVPPEWAEKRMIGAAEHEESYADLYGSEWIGILRRELAPDCLALRLNDLDAAILQASAPRRLTQRASRIAFQAGFDGIHYRSRYGHDVQNWALFEPFKLNPGRPMAIEKNDPDLERALAIHALRFADVER